MNLYIINANDNILMNFMLVSHFKNIYYTKERNVQTPVADTNMKFIQVSLPDILSNITADSYVIFNRTQSKEDNQISNEVLKLTKHVMFLYDLDKYTLSSEMLVLSSMDSQDRLEKLELLDLRTMWDTNHYILPQVKNSIDNSTTVQVVTPLMRIVDYPDENTFLFEVKAFWIHSNSGSHKPTGYLIKRDKSTNELSVSAVTTSQDIEELRGKNYAFEQFCIITSGMDLMQLKLTASFYTPVQTNQQRHSSTPLPEHHSFVTADFRVKDKLTATPTQYQQPVQQTQMQQHQTMAQQSMPYQQPMSQVQQVVQPMQQPTQPQQTFNKVSEGLKPKPVKRRSALSDLL